LLSCRWPGSVCWLFRSLVFGGWFSEQMAG
jgi:hypothetical protein